MTLLPDQKGPPRESPEAFASEMEAVAAELVALVEEFEGALSEGLVPPAFTERLAQIRLMAERLV
jgi:hypothetical protein